MSRIRNKDTEIEVEVRKYLFHKGYRYRKNVYSLPGKPDIVLSKYKTVIFIHGCFWHRHNGCKNATTPKTRTEFWQKKFDQNVANDRIHQDDLVSKGWHIIVLWECDIKKRFIETMQNVIDNLQQQH